MLVLYVAMRYDYGSPELGLSFEHCNFYDSLHNMGCDILYFDFMTLMQEHGQGWMSERLLEVATAEKPDLMFTFLFRDELDMTIIRKISDLPDTVTVNWFADDHWRFEKFSRHWAPCFNWVTTTAASALPRYERMGYANVIKTQWACNHFLYRPTPGPPEYDVTFVGMPHGTRRETIRAVRKAGMDVRVWGRGWEEGRVSQDRMIEVFNRSRINLNLSNASVDVPRTRGLGGRVGRAIRRLFGGSGPADGREQAGAPDQIKGRNFEVPGCGGFLLTGRAENLEAYYEIGREIVCFESTEELIEKARYYLEHEEERAAIARAGYERTMKEHTYPHRFAEIFRHAGLPGASGDAFEDEAAGPGETREIA